MAIQLYTFESREEENYWVYSEIEKLLQNGHKPQEIAVISRKHDSLKELVDVLEKRKIPFNYEKGQNIFENQVVTEILTILDYLSSLENPAGSKDHLLAEILAFPFWQIEALKLWQISQKAYQQRKGWLEIIIESQENSQLRQIGLFLVELAKLSKTFTAQRIIDLVIGNADLKEINETRERPFVFNSELENFHSPFKDYYFNSKEITVDYLSSLSAFRVLNEAIEKRSNHKPLKVEDLVEYYLLLQKNLVPLIDNSIYSLDPNGVQLLTAHKSKGLEFETVFILNCTKSQWEGKKGNSRLALPGQYNISAESDNSDDFLRLFYVALTRAKKNLVLTRPTLDVNSKNLEPLSFLDEDWQDFKYSKVEKENILSLVFSTEKDHVYTGEEKKLLRSSVENYQLSPSDLICFLDLERSGPREFIERVLLKFPQPKRGDQLYGTAIHCGFKVFYHTWQTTKIKPDKNFLISEFKKSLLDLRLENQQTQQYLDQGSFELGKFWDSQNQNFKIEAVSEFNFRNQNVFLAEAHLTGQTDRIEVDEDTKTVYCADYKTGKPLYSWKGDSNSSSKVWRFQTQLYFYKILIENSTRFGKSYNVNSGGIEFIKPDNETGETVVLKLDMDSQKAQEIEDLVKIVFNKIVNLDFPDTSIYESNNSGTLAFIEDLLKGNL